MTFDGIDDCLLFDFTGSGGFVATCYHGTVAGLAKGQVAVPDGIWQLPANPLYLPTNSLLGLILVEGEPGTAQDIAVRKWFGTKGCLLDFDDQSSVAQWFRYRTDLLSLDTSFWHVSPTSMNGFVRQASSLVTLDLTGIDTSQMISCNFFAAGANALSNVILGPDTFRNSPCTDYGSAFQSTNLSQTSIDNILTAIAAAGTSGGTFLQGGGAAPSAAGKAAIDTLRDRSWSVSVKGGY